MSRRDDEKRRRRLKRVQKRQRPSRSLDNLHDPNQDENPLVYLKDLKRLLELPQPAHWPGACDASLGRPDLVKLDFAQTVTSRQPGKAKIAELEERFRKGVLGVFPNMGHWAMEEFFWHGLPNDRWHPLDEYLALAGERFPPPAREQLRRWKEAKLSLLIIGNVRDDVVELQQWDPYQQRGFGPELQAISLGIGGVSFYRRARGQITLSYLAPWSPADGISCTMGYGLVMPPEKVCVLLPYLGLEHPEIVGRPMPWEESRKAEQEYLRAWQSREWHRWLQERMQFPFQAVVPMLPGPRLSLKTVSGLLPSTAEQARQFGIYFEVAVQGGEAVLLGATAVPALDVTGPNPAALREYTAYRRQVGPPPGLPQEPTLVRIQ